MSEWISVEERLPDIDLNAPGYDQNVRVLAAISSKYVREMKYERNAYAKTEKGRTPRWVEINGSLSYSPVTHWMPLPEPPK